MNGFLSTFLIPGLVREGEQQDAVTKIPGLAQLAGSALLNSPQAPQQVKAFARNLVEGLLSDTMAKQVNANLEIIFITTWAKLQPI